MAAIMRTSVVLFALLASTSIASAESYDATQPLPPKDSYVNVGASAGVMRIFAAGVNVDGGMRLGDSPLFAHGQVAVGKSGSGAYQQARTGIEARGCITQGWLCGFGGLDVGYQHDHADGAILFGHPQHDLGSDQDFYDVFAADELVTDSHDLLAVPRVGIEVGRELRARLVLELPAYTSLDEQDCMSSAGVRCGNGAGLMVSAGLGYAF